MGIAGVSGNGQSELLDCLSGIRYPDKGSISIDGRDLAAQRVDPRERRKLGIAHVPEDRLRVGVVASFTAENNAILGYHDLRPYSSGMFLDKKSIRSEARKRCSATTSAHRFRPCGFRRFLGGNQQKLVIA